MVESLTRRRLMGNIASLLSGSALAQGFSAVALLLTARQLGPAGYGRYAASFALTTFSAIIFNLGLNVWLLREGGRRTVPLSESVGSVLAIKVGGAVIWLGVVFALTPLLPQDTFPATLLRLSALATLLDSLLGTVLTAFKAALLNQVTSVLESGADAAWLVATLLLIASDIRQVEAYMQARVVVLLFGLVISLLVVWRSIALTIAFRTVKRALREAFPFVAAEFLAWISLRMDVLILAWTLGESAVGLYSPAVGVVNALFLVPAAVYGVMVPVLSHLYAANPRQAEVMARRMVLTLLAVGLGLALAFAAGAPLLISFLRGSFSESLGVMRILSVILLFKSGSFALSAVLVAIGRQSQRTVIQAVTAALNVGLNIWIVYRAGIYGVAGVYVLTELLTLAGYAWLVQRYHSRPLAYGTVSPGPQVTSTVPPD